MRSINMRDVEVHRMLPVMRRRKRNRGDVRAPVETDGTSKWLALRVSVALPNAPTNLGLGRSA
jgi:hypothetical protein